jgi:hypothetical protein
MNDDGSELNCSKNSGESVSADVLAGRGGGVFFPCEVVLSDSCVVAAVGRCCKGGEGLSDEWSVD